MSQTFWDGVTVVGCGLMGASFALALRRAGACGRVAGWDTEPAALDAALARGAIDEVDEAFAGGTVSRADFVYLAAPVGQIVETLSARSYHFKPGAVVTDAGSTKAEVCRAARELRPRGWRFVGGHPVAGSHLGGAAHAREDLFDGAPYVLAEAEDAADAEATAALAGTLELMGARVRVMTAAEHDRALALVSHLPQLVSCALASAVEGRADAESLKDLAGAGYRDMTRLAASPWGVWRDILASNAENVAGALDAVIAQLAAARDELRGPSRRGGVGELAATRSLFARSRSSVGSN
ncbi:MAG: prephenate dehydrogenase/arogenate dehydrogenase family protein [Acidobacteria bacterium]|nr:prephenate dehydrogenase/arogenate dehydrogenase family protein [Acidobacteriota bacterium]